MATIAIDLDGTLVRKAWPGIGEWFPGAKQALQRLLDEGHTPFIYTARTNPYYLDGSLAPVGEVLGQLMAVRHRLDDAGFEGIEVWDGHGKPFYHVIVDDRALWFPGRNGSWRHMPDKITARAKR